MLAKLLLRTKQAATKNPGATAPGFLSYLCTFQLMENIPESAKTQDKYMDSN